jgi:hypothetical protein
MLYYLLGVEFVITYLESIFLNLTLTFADHMLAKLSIDLFG